jgi:hypothetical protein
LLLVILFLVTLTNDVTGQVVNSLSPDQTNIYFHALDTVLKQIRKASLFEKVYVRGEKSIIQNFPDSVAGVLLVKRDSTIPLDKIKLKGGDAIITIRPVSIIRDEFTVSILAGARGGHLGDGVYICYYKYTPESQTFRLIKIKSGIRL